ncbi:polysaccharide deacetylase family protein [Paucibacter sp. APW11]|uniref:Polysaccharide deacetylase family protein n=1 Tax=Roseateles aquae TaxID=3077235 RepID=A0ABU3PA11_9BURK|nr:polysaccharide deacetylase family protein [Paucibacter sp. APW11]MDT8999380.1 polysaccharide deacetylase family protein [Paucibacter sp. APW11]
MFRRAGLTLAVTLSTSLLLSACQPAKSSLPAPAPAASAHAGQLATLQRGADELLAHYRQMIVLMDGERALKPAARRAVASVGQLLFHDLQTKTQALSALGTESADPALLAALAQLLDRIESEPTWFDADRLAFKEFLSALAQFHGSSQSLAGIKLAKRANEDLAVLAEVEQSYEAELKDSFGRFAKRGIELKREKWSDYVAKLRGLYSREQIMKDYATILPYATAMPDAGKSGAPAAAAEAASEAGREATRGATEQRELFGDSLPPKTVLLTFDDGPHPRYTDEILDILKRYQAPAVFFQLGQNLGKVDDKGQVLPGHGSKVAQRVQAAGHMLANHSFSHGLMSKFELDKVRREAADTEALLDGAGRSGAPLFRMGRSA